MSKIVWQGLLNFCLGYLICYLIFQADAPYLLALLAVLFGTIGARLLSEALGND